jgi:hypothetical protein
MHKAFLINLKKIRNLNRIHKSNKRKKQKEFEK